jgi:hypothetical protein
VGESEAKLAYIHLEWDRLGADAVHDGADCLIIDAEGEYEGKYVAAQSYISWLRHLIGQSYPVALAGFPYIDYHPGFPYSVFLGPGGAQYNWPQMYWKDIGTSVGAVYEHTYTYNGVYQRAIDPLGQVAANPPMGQIIRFRQLSRTYGAAGVSWWDWQQASTTGWKSIAIGAGNLTGVSVAGDLGDQQAATFGQACFDTGDAKNTYGTGNFMLLNTSTEPVQSKSGLLTTACYKIGDQPAVYALEGSIAITGALVQWLRDNLKMIKAAPEVEELAQTVDDNGGLYIVPAFSGLFAPYWKSNARGVFAGLTRYVNAGHIARATLEATAFQTREVMDAMETDSGVTLNELKVDGGMVANDLLMQFQADILGVPVIRPQVAETTALGAAYAAGLAVGFWDSEQSVRDNWAEDKRWEPKMDAEKRDEYYKFWKKAVTRTFDWFDSAA